MTFANAYQDRHRAEAYDALAFDGTYHLAFRELPGILEGRRGRALDFGCGTGRSTRFLQSLGFETIGTDIAPEMLAHARAHDPEGRYLQIAEGDVVPDGEPPFDVALAAFTFDNVPTWDLKRRILGNLRRAVRPGGLLVSIVSSPELYVHEWASFSTRDFPENRAAKSGDPVRCVTTTLADARPCVDVLVHETDYRAMHVAAGFRPLDVHKPLARGNEPYAWVTERRVAPWHVHVVEG